ncbi:hypothetical protein N9I12_03155 [Gammaproteobacteria bacterium]|nr:hypothetical protein [Gammaproteobacteria bacterium]
MFAMRLGKDFLILIALFALSAGVYYSAAKFHIPWYGASDFSRYYQMTLNPFDYFVESPFAYRMFVPVIAHFIYESGLFYESSLTPYKDYYLSQGGIDYEPSILSAIIFTNYIFLALAAFFSYKSIKVIFAQSNHTDHIMPVMLSSLIFLSFSTNVHGYAGLTEGGSHFLVSLLCYLALKNHLILFSLICISSILCRELIPLVLTVYVVLASAQKRRSYFIIISALAFMTYFALRSYFQIPGAEYQTDLNSLISNLLTFSLTKPFFMQAILANNITIFVGLLAIYTGGKHLKPFVPYVIIIVILSVLGIATGLGNNLGRILNIATPILVICLAEMICRLRPQLVNIK